MLFLLLASFCFGSGTAREVGSAFLNAIVDLQEHVSAREDLSNDLDSFLVGALTPNAISTGLLGDPDTDLSRRLDRLELNQLSNSASPLDKQTNSTASNATATNEVICDTKHNVYKWAAVLLNVILLVVAGMPLCVAGYRLFKPALFLFGFGTCFMLVYQLIIFHNFHGEKEWVAPLCATIGGLIGGILAVGMWQIGLFLIGFALGGFSVVAVLMIVAQASADATKYLHEHAWEALVMVVVAGCILGVLTIKFEKPLIIAATALEGSWIIFQAIDYFVENTGSDVGQTVRLIVQFIPRNSQLVTPWHAALSSCWLVNICFCVWPTSLIIGLCVQVFITGKNFDHRAGHSGKKGPDLKPKSFDAQHGYAV